jgi:cytochrome b
MNEIRDEKTALFVWDEPTRIFHWALVALVATAWATGEAESDFLFQLHLAAGYGVVGLLIFRVIWGFLGSRHALFADFVRPWRVVRDYAKQLMTFRPPHCIGHNPLGGWMVILLIVALAVLVTTGMFSREVEDGKEIAGPLAHYLSAGASHGMKEIHEVMFNVILVLVGIHVAGVVTDMVLTRDNLIRAMITGYKSVPSAAAKADGGAGTVRYAWAVLAAAAAAGLTWYVVTL